jgi:hypothetical protein
MKKMNNAKANAVRANAFLAKTAWTAKAITAVIDNKDAFAKASKTTTRVAVLWMIHNPDAVATLVATNATAWDIAVAVLTAAAPRVMSIVSDIDFNVRNNDMVARAADADAALIRDIVDNHDADLLASAMADIFWLPSKSDIMAAMNV